MVEPVPNTLGSLADAIERKLTELDPFLDMLRDKYSTGSVAKKYGFTKPNLNDDGRPISGSVDLDEVPEDIIKKIELESEPHGALTHIAKDMTNGLLSLISEPNLTHTQRLEKSIQLMDLTVEDIKEEGALYPHISVKPLLDAANGCKTLCEDFLRRQEQQAKSAGGSRGA